MRLDFKLRRQTVLRPIIPTQAQENSLAKLYLDVVKVWTNGAAERIIPAYSRTLSGLITDDVADIDYQIAETDSAAVRAVLNFSSLFRGWLFDFNTWHFRRFNSNLKYSTNVDLNSIIGEEPTETLESIIARNTALVRAVSDQTRERISDIVYRGLTNRTPVREVAKEIATATGLARDRARRIASDQLVKASAAFDESRMRDIGITKFKWMHSEKKNFRPEHKARDGKIYNWDDPVIKNDKPGYAPFCGCKARGVIEGDA